MMVILIAMLTGCSPAPIDEEEIVPPSTAESTPETQAQTESTVAAVADAPLPEAEVEVLAFRGHVHTYFFVGMESQPSCEEEGCSVSRCIECGKKIYETTPALGHGYVLLSETAASCEAAGERVYQCTRCADTDTESVDALGHDYQVTASESATCESAGSVTYTCTRCGSQYTVTVSALGHSWIAATTTAPKTCSRCGAQTGSPLAVNTEGTTAEEIIATAMEYLGVPYVWGGTTPSGFDCSGFVQYVFALHGITLPRTSREQYCVGVAVDRSELQPGDLVFFETGSNGVSHLGIYIGDGQFINATVSRGIAISDLSNSYWDTRYWGARRIL